MRISDWSSDVFSSDLLAHQRVGAEAALAEPEIKARAEHDHREQGEDRPEQLERQRAIIAEVERLRQRERLGIPGHRARVGEVARLGIDQRRGEQMRSDEHTSELPSLMRISYAV